MFYKYQKGFSITSYMIGGSFILVLLMFILWQMEKVKSSTLQGSLNLELQKNEFLKSVNDQNEKNIKTNIELIETSDREEDNLKNKLDESRKDLFLMIQKNMELKFYEETKAKKDRYVAGINSANRINSILCKTAGYSESCNNTSSTSSFNREDSRDSFNEDANSPNLGD